MDDFVNVRNGSFVAKINSIILKGEEHVFNCEVRQLQMKYLQIKFEYKICSSDFFIAMHRTWLYLRILC